MAYVDLRPYKPKLKKKEEETSTGIEPIMSNDATDFLSNLAGVGEQETSSSSSSFGSTTTSNKDDVIEILNLLNEKLSRVEEKMHRIERKIDEKDRY